ncbi:hypothetical protein Cflav_PD5549 [Pedosphaera parvula Ellin514]|uniref:Uncharacterized protein n=1 Tax=Pedosphaera parvula (strain Ellin514) TaxID=320771 RepID=B9XBM9_PEDPL|nr:hypothetical protein Cflav_PD5549 [Pedosphaera parvula Ellin514]
MAIFAPVISWQGRVISGCLGFVFLIGTMTATAPAAKAAAQVVCGGENQQPSGIEIEIVG